MKKLSKGTGLIIFIALMVSSTFFALSKYKAKDPIKIDKQVPGTDTVTNNIIDTAKLGLLTKVYKNLDPNRNEYFLSGLINANNGADTSDHLLNTEYVLSKRGNEVYLKFGQTETINANGICIYIDHGMKKIMLSKSSEVITGLAIPNLTEQVKKIREEGFKMKSDKTGDTERIVLSNPYHLSCKEYAVSFNSNTLKPERIYVRLSSFEEPENTKMDNVIDFKINQTASASGIDKYTEQNFVKKQGKEWALNPGYKGYELINTLN